jgi:hypothetical protein
VNFCRPAAQNLNFCWHFSQKVLLRAIRLVTKWAPTTRTLPVAEGSQNGIWALLFDAIAKSSLQFMPTLKNKVVERS